MFTQETLHHAAIEDIVRDLLSRIEALESAHPDIIIKPNEADAEMEKLKAENKRLEYYDNQLRDKIQKLELNAYHFERIPNISGNSIDKIIVNTSEYNSLSHKIKDLSSKVEFLEKENKNIEKEVNTQALALKAFNEICDNIPQWKNSLIDGLPVLKLGDILIYKEPHDTNYKMLDCVSNFDLKSSKEYLEDNPASEYIIIKMQNATN